MKKVNSKTGLTEREMKQMRKMIDHRKKKGKVQLTGLIKIGD